MGIFFVSELFTSYVCCVIFELAYVTVCVIKVVLEILSLNSLR